MPELNLITLIDQAIGKELTRDQAIAFAAELVKYARGRFPVTEDMTTEQRRENIKNFAFTEQPSQDLLLEAAEGLIRMMEHDTLIKTAKVRPLIHTFHQLVSSAEIHITPHQLAAAEKAILARLAKPPAAETHTYT